MKKIALGIMMLFCACSTFAQKAPVVEYSPGFEEPNRGCTRLMMMENGNTVFLVLNEKLGIVTTIFDPQHKQTAKHTASGKAWKVEDLGRSDIRAIYEINSQIVIFLTQPIDRIPTLFRIVIDGKTGKLIEESILGTLPKTRTSADKANHFGQRMPIFHVVKDPQSGYYAVLRYEVYATNPKECIQVKHYSPDHKEINNGFYEPPKASNKNIYYQAMYVQQGESVFLVTEVSNNYYYDGSLEVYISRLSKDAKTFEHKKLDYMTGYELDKAGIQYDEANKTLLVLLQAKMSSAKRKQMNLGKKDPGGVAYLDFVDPFTLKPGKKAALDISPAAEYSQKMYKKEFKPALQHFMINNDGTITVLLEEIGVVNTSKTTSTGGSWSTGSYTDVTDVGVLKLNATGGSIDGYAIRKNTFIQTRFEPLTMYHAVNGRDLTYRSLFWGNDARQSFYSYRYLHTGGYEYVLFNDHLENIQQKDPKAKLKRFTGISHTHAMCYRRSGDDIEKFYLFKTDKEDPEKVNRFMMIESTATSRDQKSIATLVVEQQIVKREEVKKAYIAWVTFE